MADYSLKQGDAGAVVLSDTLTYSDGSIANVTGASIQFVMRARSQNAATTSAAATIVDGTNGKVSYTPTATDTANAGLFSQYWIVTFAGGQIERFPTVGYNTVEIQENLETANQTIVELDDLKDYLNFPANDRTKDGELLRFLQGIVPVVENITGPILPRVYQDEQYDTPTVPYISLRHRPIISVAKVVEYRANVGYNLTQIETPDQGTIYSYTWQPEGRIVRRTVGGGMVAFPLGVNQIWVTYTAGQATITQNVRLAACELVRVNYQQTQQAGRGPIGGYVGDENLPGVQMLGFFVPNRVRELLAPNRRYPSIA